MLENFKKSRVLIWLIDILLVGLLILNYGFERFEEYESEIIFSLLFLFLTLLGINLYIYLTTLAGDKLKRITRINLLVLGVLGVIELIFIITAWDSSLANTYLETHHVLEYGLSFYFFVQLTFFLRWFYTVYFNPALLFVVSFAIVALSGALLLMLPASTTHGISFIDALFTATSATAVTGLIVVDTGTAFTTLGHTILIILIQIGGLGMLTFTSFFAYFFKTGSTFSESLYMKNILSNEKMDNVMSFVMQIVVFSLVVEAIGALFIYNSLQGSEVFDSRIYASVFHAISAYCNAGFSTASGNLMEPGLVNNYYLQWIIMALIVFGGLGYGIASNFIQYLKRAIHNLFHREKRIFNSRTISLNSKIVVYTTGILLVLGTVFFMFTEQNTVLTSHHSFFGKLTTSLFSSVTARTCGFATFDYGAMSVPGILIMILLMWIGASPNSTGGGIKTTTFSLAVMNIFSTARGMDNIEIGTRRIPKDAVRKSFAIIAISLITVGVSILLILFFDPQFSLIQVAFEAFSAMGTVGLTMGITGDLSTASKLVIIFLMLFGRVGIINIMIGILKHRRTTQYTYPKENIIIT